LSQETGSEITLSIMEVFAHLASPLPAQLEQVSTDGQYFLWQSNLAGGWSAFNDVDSATVRIKWVDLASPSCC
jgi:hypothetical protein